MQDLTHNDLSGAQNVLMSGNDLRIAQKISAEVYQRSRGAVCGRRAAAPGVNALALTYDYALRENWLADALDTGNRMLSCRVEPGSAQQARGSPPRQQTGCAQQPGERAFAAILSATHQVDADLNTDYGDRFSAYLNRHGPMIWRLASR